MEKLESKSTLSPWCGDGGASTQKLPDSHSTLSPLNRTKVAVLKPNLKRKFYEGRTSRAWNEHAIVFNLKRKALPCWKWRRPSGSPLWWQVLWSWRPFASQNKNNPDLDLPVVCLAIKQPCIAIWLSKASYASVISVISTVWFYCSTEIAMSCMCTKLINFMSFCMQIALSGV